MMTLDTAPGTAVADDEPIADTAADTDEADAAGDAMWAEMAALRAGADDDPPAAAAADEPDDEDDDDEPAATAAAADTGAPATDIWAGASEAHRKAFEAAEARAAAAEQRIRSDDGRVAAYQRQIDELKRKGAASAAPSAPKDDNLKKIAEDYPEIVNPIMERFSALEGTLNGMTEGQRAAAEAAALEANETKLTELHPDWLTIRTDPRLSAWIGTQPQYVREAAEMNGSAIVDVEAAADLVSRFKQSIGIAPTGSPATAVRPTPAAPPNPAPMADRRRRQLEASTGVTNRAPAAASGVPDDPDAQWAYFKAKREREQASHR